MKAFHDEHVAEPIIGSTPVSSKRTAAGVHWSGFRPESCCCSGSLKAASTVTFPFCVFFCPLLVAEYVAAARLRRKRRRMSVSCKVSFTASRTLVIAVLSSRDSRCRLSLAVWPHLILELVLLSFLGWPDKLFMFLFCDHSNPTSVCLRNRCPAIIRERQW